MCATHSTIPSSSFLIATRWIGRRQGSGLIGLAKHTDTWDNLHHITFLTWKAINVNPKLPVRYWRILLREFSSAIHAPVAIHAITNPADIHDSTYSTYTYKKHRNGSPTSENWKVRWLQSRCEATAVRMACNAKHSARKAKMIKCARGYATLGRFVAVETYGNALGLNVNLPAGSQAGLTLKSEIEVRLKSSNVHVTLLNCTQQQDVWLLVAKLNVYPPQMTPVFFRLLIFGWRGSSTHMQLGQNWITAPPWQKSHDKILCESTQTHRWEEFKTQGFLGHYTSVLHFPFHFYTPLFSFCSGDSDYFLHCFHMFFLIPSILHIELKINIFKVAVLMLFKGGVYSVKASLCI